VLRATGLLIVLGVCALVATMVLAVRGGNQQVAAKLGLVTADWSSMLDAGVQITAAGGMLGLGVGAAWIFGREFADGTVSALFGLPVDRRQIAAAKLAVFGMWSALVCTLLTAGLLVTGLAVGLGAPDSAAVAGLGRELVLGLLTALVAVPAGWAATWGRGLLAGVAGAVCLLVLAQVWVLSGAGVWMPLVAPAMWAMEPSAATTAALVVVPSVPVVFGVATVVLWRRLQLDR
jgi:ABC-2 type transport system permease protein